MTGRRHKSPKRRRGLFTLEAMVGLAMLAVIAGALAVAAVRQERTARALAESRAAMRLAERALIDLQAAREPVASEDSMTVGIAPAGAGGENVAGYRWVQVTVTYGPKHQNVVAVGLVPLAKESK